MTVTAQSTVLSWGIQADADTQPTSWYQHRALRSTLSELDDVRVLDPELGGVAVPDGAYKVGPMGGGSIILQPRLKGSIGYLLKALTGDVTSTTDANTNVTTHVFAFGGIECLPWVGVRTHIKGGCNGVPDLGRILVGARIIGAQLDFTIERPLQATFAFRSKTFQFDDNPSGWTYANTLEDYSTMPLGVQEGSYIKIPGFSSGALPIVAATVGFVNNPLDVRFDRSYGHTGLDDITITDHAMTIDATVKWKDPSLYRAILTGSATGTAWTSTVFEQDFQATAVAPAIVGSGSDHYMLQIDAPRVLWRINGGLDLAGRDAVMIRLNGTVLLNGDGVYAKITLKNDTASYS